MQRNTKKSEKRGISNRKKNIRVKLRTEIMEASDKKK